MLSQTESDQKEGEGKKCHPTKKQSTLGSIKEELRSATIADSEDYKLPFPEISDFDEESESQIGGIDPDLNDNETVDKLNFSFQDDR